MADYGALMGLGQGLQEVGMTMFKSHLAKKLAAEREAAEEQRIVAREERADRRLRARPDPDQSAFIERDGALFKQVRNAYGEVIDEALASADEIDKRNYTKQKQRNEITLGELNVTGKGLLNQINAAKAADADKLTDLELAVKESMIRKNDSQGQAALIRANKTGSGSGANAGEPASMNEYANLLKKESKDVIAQYKAEDETLTATEINRITRQAVEQAAKYNIEPQILLERMLQERQRDRGLQAAIRSRNDNDDGDDE